MAAKRSVRSWGVICCIPPAIMREASAWVSSSFMGSQVFGVGGVSVPDTHGPFAGAIDGGDKVGVIRKRLAISARLGKELALLVLGPLFWVFVQSDVGLTLDVAIGGDEGDTARIVSDDGAVYFFGECSLVHNVFAGCLFVCAGVGWSQFTFASSGENNGWMKGAQQQMSCCREIVVAL
jgi:hypothetical protein